MRAVVTRVKNASVEIGGRINGQIGQLLLFSRGGNRMFSAQEGFAATGLSWIFMSAFIR